MVLEHSKFVAWEHLSHLARKLHAEQKKIVLCHGHFNVIHPGHLRFLNFAKSIGDIVVVSVMHEQELTPENREIFFNQNERALGVANLELVDLVIRSPGQVIPIIENLAPNFYLKGKEFELRTDEMQAEKDTVERLGGKLVFSSGEVEYSSTKFLSNQQNPEKSLRQKYSLFLESCQKHEVNLKKIKDILPNFSQLKILVIGDTIVDQFVACDALGLSSEAPVMVLRELESKQFLGGAAIVSRHVRSLGAQCSYLSVIGIDEPANFVETELSSAGIKSFLQKDETRPTTFKTRYVVGNQKILRVSRLHQHQLSKELEDRFCSELERQCQNLDGVIISDFVYGMITERILDKISELKQKYKFRVFGDTQCSSQFGDVSKFQNIELITPTEKEARIALNDQSSGLEKLGRDLIEKTGNQNLVVTLGADGILVFSRNPEKPNTYVSDFFCALEENPIDVSGAGDAMLTGYALGLCSGLNIMECSLLASCMSAVSVMRMGNIPIQHFELSDYLDNLINYKEKQKYTSNHKEVFL